MTTTTHTIRWHGITRDDEGRVVRIPRNRYMTGRDWGWDATCSCGWDSHTGGAIEVRIREAVADHKWDVANGFWSPDA